MKCLTVIACLVVFAAAQQKNNFRGASQNDYPKQFGNNQKQGNGDNQKQNLPGYQNKNKWSQQKGNSQKQQNNKRQNKGKWTQQFYNKDHKCTVTQIPQDLQSQYAAEFKALDVDNNGVLSSSEFKDEGDKISDAFSNFRKGNKPSWYKGNKNGNKNDNKNQKNDNKNQDGGYKRPGRGGNQNGGQNNQNGGFGRPGRGGNQNQNGGQNNQNQKGGRGGRGRGGRGERQLAEKDDAGTSFWKYLADKGFVPKKPTQTMKDKLDSMRAAAVFRKFDQDNNKTVSLCEYENAMYRTQKLEKMMNNKNNGPVVVHG